ncbi:hypothetical protein TNCV_2492291 [Trichonephila clavipes]|nr:hypothetical protein TNCV_2492291 [Trichonephila clavipes]
MDVCKGVVCLLHKGVQNNRRDASPLVRLVEMEDRWKALTTSTVFSFKIEVEWSQIVQSPVRCSKLRLTTGGHLALCHVEFRVLRFDTVRQVALAGIAINRRAPYCILKRHLLINFGTYLMLDQ